MNHVPSPPSLRPSMTRRFPPLMVVFVALALGVLADHRLSAPVEVWLAVAVGSLLGWFVLWWVGWNRTAGVVLLLAVACAGGARHHQHWNLYGPDELGQAASDSPRPICLEAVALSSPRRVAAPPDNPLRTRPVGERSRLLVRVVRARDGQAWRAASGTAELLVDGHLLGIRAGDRLQVFAVFQRPSRPLNPGEFDFAWHRRCERQLVELVARFPDSVTVLASGTLWNWRRILAAVRDPCHSRLVRYLDRRQAGLASALLLGVREHVDWERTEPFVTTGTVHLLAISGIHVGILAVGFWWIARLLVLRRTVAIVSAIACVALYAVLTDARPPVVRATVLVVAFCLARLSGRRSSGFNALAAAALVLAGWNPTAIFQAGAQLSFVAVMTIYLVTPRLVMAETLDPLERLIDQHRPWYARGAEGIAGTFGKLILMSAAIWLVALPLTAYRYHLVSPIALVLNPVAWIPVSVALFAGFGVLIFGSLVPPAAIVCGWICNHSLGLLEWMIDQANQVGGGHLWTPPPAAWWVLGYYVGLAVWAVWFRRRLPARWCIALMALWLAVGALTTVRRFPDGNGRLEPLVCTFLAVGHGACTVLELPRGQTLLYDAGSMSAPETTARTIAGFLWSRRITHLDAVVLSHADADHFNTLPELLKRFTVGVVYVSPVMFERDAPALAALQEAIHRQGIPVIPIHAGNRLRVRDASRWQVLHPPPDGAAGSDNANSLTLQVDYSGRTILLTGDLEPPGLDDVMSAGPIDCDVATAPHHGSPRSLPEAFVAWCQPEWLIISAAANQGAAAFRAAATVPGARALNTGRSGAVQVTVGEDRLEVRAWRRDPW